MYAIRSYYVLTLIQAELRRSGFEDLIAAGIVLTGGSAKIEGLIDLAEEIFHMPVRLGTPQYVTGLVDVVRNPIYATGVGLLVITSYSIHYTKLYEFCSWISNGRRSSQATTPPGPEAKPPMPSTACGRRRSRMTSACSKAISSMKGASSRRITPFPRSPDTRMVSSA